MNAERAELVSAYWRNYRLSRGSRSDRLAADADFWAWEAVEQVVDERPAEAVDLIDDLLHADEADLAYLAAGPLEDLLSDHPEQAAAVAERCRRDSAWSQAIKSVWLNESDQARLGPLRAMLPPPVGG